MQRISILFFLISYCPVFLHAQDETGSPDSGDTIVTNVDIFEGQDPLEFTLTLDLKHYQREKYKAEYIPAELLIHVNDTLDIEKTMRIKSRGEFRKSHCQFAPYWLNIRKAGVENIYLQEVKKIKIVTHCRGAESYADYVLKEYLAYRIYNILSPISFRVRLVRMKYVDTGRKNKVTENWAFMIEPEEMLAERHDALVVKNDKLAMAHMKRDEMLKAALFMYMIGNADYSVSGRHNMKLLGLPGFGSTGYTPVPYDFDYSGLVNAAYAVPGENLGIASVRERYYLGPCREEAEYQAGIDFMEEHREEILELVQGFPHLNEREKNRIIAYIESYYISATGKGFIKQELNSTCR